MLSLSYGAGVQSSVLLMLAIRDEIERPDVVVFADTGLEPKAVYRHLEWSKRQAEKAGIAFHVIGTENTMRDQFEAFERGERKHWDVRPPLYVRNAGGGSGQLRRQCTRNVKIKPVHRFLVQACGAKTARTLADGQVGIMIGISTDEARRASLAKERWIDRIFPLIDPLKMSRGDCQAWWDRHYPHVPLPSSSCIICPYKSTANFAALRAGSPEDWADACDLDARITAAYRERTQQEAYCSREMIPLSELAESAQTAFDLDDEIYCSGGCGM